MHAGVPKSRFIPKTLGKLPLEWDFGMSIEDALRVQGGYLQKMDFFEIA